MNGLERLFFAALASLLRFSAGLFLMPAGMLTSLAAACDRLAQPPSGIQ